MQYDVMIMSFDVVDYSQNAPENQEKPRKQTYLLGPERTTQ